MCTAGPIALRRAVAVMFVLAFAGDEADRRSVVGESQGVDIPALVRRMTLDEKLSLVHGARDPQDLGEAGYWPGLPRLGIPPLRLADGPPGVNVKMDATGMPAPLGLGATFNVEAARLYGAVLGRDARALGQNILLAPHVNIIRDPLFRRNHTTLSEDPTLTAQLAAAEIVGIQSQGTMAQVKHLAGYTGPDNVFIDERTLHEIYLPAFEAAVKAGVASVMCAYNQVNGAWACENAGLQDGILRGQWGFQGFVTCDWGAVHNPLAIAKGVDLEMPGRELAFRSGPYFTDPLKKAVEDRAVPVLAIDQAVTRILRQMDRFHLLGSKQPAPPAAIDVVADGKIVREIAEQSAVLLKNDGQTLPLGMDDLRSLAVIGPTGGQPAVGYLGERGRGFENRLVAPLAALRASAPGASIDYTVGDDLTGETISGLALSHGGQPGLVRTQTAPATGATQVDRALDFKGREALEPGTEYTWAGTLTVAGEADYTFMVQAGGRGAEGGGTITIDGHPTARSGVFGTGGVVDKKWSSLLPTTDGRDNARAGAHLTAGAHRIEITASSIGGAPLDIRFAWMTPELRQANIAAAVAAAKAAGTVVLFAWNDVGIGFSLPEDQDELIAKVAAANPRTIVVLNTCSPVAMPWRDRVRAILEMWYPGQEGGWATANVLLGRTNPGGKLPITFPMKLDDAPARALGHPERLAQPLPASLPSGANADAPAVTFSEGISVGYRWYDQQNIEPLFPFGHGLSYTRFDYSDPAITRGEDGIDVTFTLRNSGTRKGAEVPQVYVGPPRQAPVPMAPRALVAFQRIELDPGHSQTVTMRIDWRKLSYWSSDRHAWVVAEGDRPVWVGSSSRDMRLRLLARRYPATSCARRTLRESGGRFLVRATITPQSVANGQVEHRDQQFAVHVWEIPFKLIKPLII